ncbi:MAG: hypothetical protein JNL01_13650 [Bdellovibrionales bacterium]|nr:hypothetical protein [Bdellovibrionales bacterium]
MKNLILGAFALLLMISNSWAQIPAEGGSSTIGGGGDLIPNPKPVGGYELRDLVDPSTCNWVSGKDFVEKSVEFQSILSALDRLHWFFALSVKKEAARLSYCIAKLKLRGSPDDLFNDDQLGAIRVAYRMGNSVFLDQDLFENQISDRSRAWVVLHETLHSYLPMSVLARPAKHRNAVALIHQAELGNLDSVTFLDQMQKNDFEIAADLRPLATLKSLLQRHYDIRATPLEFAISGHQLFSIIEKTYGLFQMGIGSASDVVKLKGLVSAGIDVRIFLTSRFHLENLLWASLQNLDYGTLEKTLQAGVNPQVLGGPLGYDRPLPYAITVGDLRLVQLLLASPLIDPNRARGSSIVSTGSHLAPLLEAIFLKNWAIARALAQHPATDPNLQQGQAFYTALKSDHQDLAILLLKHPRAAIHSWGSSGTILDFAVENSRADWIHLILGTSGILVEKIISADRALEKAVSQGKSDLVQALLTYPGFDVTSSLKLTRDRRIKKLLKSYRKAQQKV